MAKVKAKPRMGGFIKASGHCRKGYKKVKTGRGKKSRWMCKHK